MSVSSIPAPAPAPINYLDTASTPKPPDANVTVDANDAGAAQPPVQPALPPGQGTRVNQLV